MIKNIYFLTGASGVGKTSIVDEIVKLFPEAYIQSSITRDYYKKVGIENEKDFFTNLTPTNKKKFQFDLLDFYIEFTKDKLLNFNGDIAVIDRSPIDIVSWTLYGCPETTQIEYNNLIQKCDKFFKDISELGKVNLCEFEYPCPWIKSTISSDGFRYDPFGKNLTISYIIKEEINRLLASNDIRNIDNSLALVYKKIKIFNSLNQTLSPLERANLLLE